MYENQSNFNQEPPPPQSYGYLGYNYPVQHPHQHHHHHHLLHQNQQIDINQLPHCSTAGHSNFQSTNWNIPRNAMPEKHPPALSTGNQFNNHQQYARFTSQCNNNNNTPIHRPEELSSALNVAHQNYNIPYTNDLNILPATIQTIPNEEIDNMTDSFSKLL